MSTPTPAQQRAYFEMFGFIKLPGLLKAELPQILADFEAVFPQLGLQHDGKTRTMVGSFVDQRAGLCALLDHPGILEAVGNLIGPDFNYVSSDGNYYSGDTTWHLDTAYPSNSYIKVAFYLDRVTRDTGALRVIPASHRDEMLHVWNDVTLRGAPQNYGCEQRDLPAYALESEPGDVLIFSHRLRHASFGGGNRRRMFTMNLGRRARTPQEIEDFIGYVGQWAKHASGEPYGPAMLAGAPPARKVHFAQVFDYWQRAIEHQRAKDQAAT
ncbi:MAG: phytanoyl-CoA dioxygenase family protein [Opitutaceae bacterium]|nr:phytanoyl-CoA dioxygenase family protein [Opitutaceae bacterium]